jgi:hypothetical protein
MHITHFLLDLVVPILHINKPIHSSIDAIADDLESFLREVCYSNVESQPYLRTMIPGVKLGPRWSWSHVMLSRNTSKSHASCVHLPRHAKSTESWCHVIISVATTSWCAMQYYVNLIFSINL